MSWILGFFYYFGQRRVSGGEGFLGEEVVARPGLSCHVYWSKASVKCSGFKFCSARMWQQGLKIWFAVELILNLRMAFQVHLEFLMSLQNICGGLALWLIQGHLCSIFYHDRRLLCITASPSFVLEDPLSLDVLLLRCSFRRMGIDWLSVDIVGGDHFFNLWLFGLFRGVAQTYFPALHPITKRCHPIEAGLHLNILLQGLHFKTHGHLRTEQFFRNSLVVLELLPVLVGQSYFQAATF